MSKLIQKAEAKFRRGKNKSAKEILIKVLIKKPTHPEALFLLGSILLVEKDYEKAVKYLAKATSSNNTQPFWYANYANALLKSGSYDAADKAYKIAELMGCTSIEFYTGYGRFLTSVKADYDKAELCFAKIIQQDPKYYPAYIDLGNIYNAKGEYDQVIQILEYCIKELNVNIPVLYSNLGMALSQQGRSEESLKYFDKAVELSPDFSIAVSNYILSMLNVYDDETYIYELIQRLTDSLNKNCITEFSGNIDLDKDRKINLGFVSGDFFNHAISNFISPILAALDKEKFSINLYYNNHVQDHLTTAFYNIADNWFNCFNVSTSDLEKQIRENKIDILIDLSNHTAGNRLDVFAKKSAPIQISFMGLPATTGLKSIDYRFSTEYMINQCELEKSSTEKLWPMPWLHWYMQIGGYPDITPPPFLKNGFITFGSFNGLRKMNTALVEAWAKILQKVPKSKLRLVITDINNITMQEHVYSLFEKHDIDRSRLILVGKMSIDKYMKAHNEVDIGLDTYPYNGSTTTHYDLMMGLPLASCRGKTIASNSTYAILAHIGKEEWVGDNLDEFVEIAVSLAEDKSYLATCKEDIRNKYLNSNVHKHQKTTRNLEKAFRQMWYIYCGENA